MIPPEPRFDHLLEMTDERGTFEHALFDQPRPEHGYCTDDMARVLVVGAREPVPAPELLELTDLSLRFLEAAQGDGGRYRNRLSSEGRWEDRPSTEDCWGRSIWGLGTAARSAQADDVRGRARRQFDRAVTGRSRWPRAMAFAVLGAAEMIAADPGHLGARLLLADAADAMSRPRPDRGWPWPEARLSYANAVLPEAMIAAGAALGRPVLLRDGLALLGWLVDRQTRGGHLSVTPAGGAGPADAGPSFDQQPIEVAAIADACTRAARIDDDPRWVQGVAMAVGWFVGDNDRHVVMWDQAGGGGFDGLEAGGANLNQGAESTLALLSTLQHGRRLVMATT